MYLAQSSGFAGVRHCANLNAFKQSDVVSFGAIERSEDLDDVIAKEELSIDKSAHDLVIDDTRVKAVYYLVVKAGVDA